MPMKIMAMNISIYDRIARINRSDLASYPRSLRTFGGKGKLNDSALEVQRF